MKHIVVCCDGTWNNRDRTEHDTSVAHIAQLLETSGRTDIEAIYIEGVGATSGLRGIRKAIDKLRGGALGRGLTRNILRGFRHIVKHYEPGDKIHIFGFSRGAYTARSLAGLIRSSGIPKDSRKLKSAFRRYRSGDPNGEPKTEASLEFRLGISPDFYTTETERDWRIAQGKPAGDPINIAFLGVFDTVGTNGIPGVLGQLGLVPGGHGFHDHALSSMVQMGRHAIGLDERRVLYAHTPWVNLPRLNQENGPGPEGSVRYEQQWFPGEHGKIGGSGAERRISNSVLSWILDGAAFAGLKIELSDNLKAADDDFQGSLGKPSGFDPTALIKRWRKGPTRVDDVGELHDVALMRLLWVEGYAPKSLRQFLRAQSWRQRAEARVGSTRVV